MARRVALGRVRLLSSVGQPMHLGLSASPLKTKRTASKVAASSSGRARLTPNAAIYCVFTAVVLTRLASPAELARCNLFSFLQPLSLFYVRSKITAKADAETKHPFTARRPVWLDAIDGGQEALHNGRTGSHRSRRNSALKRLRVRTASSKAQDLASLWVGGQIDASTCHGSRAHAPSRWRACETAAESRKSFPDGLRAIPAGGAAFAVTAFDPLCAERSAPVAARANGKTIWAMLKTPATRRGLTYGVDVTEGWREDGFVLAFLTAPRPRRVAETARGPKQGAIYAAYSRACA